MSDPTTGQNRHFLSDVWFTTWSSTNLPQRCVEIAANKHIVFTGRLCLLTNSKIVAMSNSLVSKSVKFGSSTHKEHNHLTMHMPAVCACLYKTFGSQVSGPFVWSYPSSLTLTSLFTHQHQNVRTRFPCSQASAITIQGVLLGSHSRNGLVQHLQESSPGTPALCRHEDALSSNIIRVTATTRVVSLFNPAHWPCLPPQSFPAPSSAAHPPAPGVVGPACAVSG